MAGRVQLSALALGPQIRRKQERGMARQKVPPLLVPAPSNSSRSHASTCKSLFGIGAFCSFVLESASRQPATVRRASHRLDIAFVARAVPLRSANRKEVCDNIPRPQAGSVPTRRTDRSAQRRIADAVG